MRLLIPALIVIAAAPAIAQDGPARDASEATPIIVIGQRAEDYRARLEACLARACPPNEDIDATLAYAETLFVDGAYLDARRALAASVNRNRRHAAAYPQPVSDLQRARALVARHTGHHDEARRASVGILEALRAGIPGEDGRHFAARLEIIEMHLATGAGQTALVQLEDLERRARRAGRPDIAARAELRRLWIRDLYLGDRAARSRLEQLSRSTDPDDLILKVGAGVLLAAIYRREGDTARSDAMIAETGRTQTAARTLLFEPPYELGVQSISRDDELIVGAEDRDSDHFHDAWIDVGFWVQGDGEVSGLEIVRQGARTDWANPLLRAIRGRRYAPNASGAPTYRLERYTYTANFEDRTGSLLRQRSRNARVEYFDLAGGAPATPPADGTN